MDKAIKGVVNAACERAWCLAQEAEDLRRSQIRLGKEPNRSGAVKAADSSYEGALRVLAVVLLEAGEDVGAPDSDGRLLASAERAREYLGQWGRRRGKGELP